jgi:alkanesulfonate monooxygenase SsuD/methylene tetrahydromethanopterin reductase-like flavin-dependent oxidoreductase (luciferase family)
MSIGVLSQVQNPSLADVRELAVAAEAAGADWLGVPDAFWWHDTWLLAAEALRATTRLAVGPFVTNPYLRHPFHTAAAVATLQAIGGPRVILGLGAGGSELPASTGIDRGDAPRRLADMVELFDRVAAGAPLSEVSGRRLEPRLDRPPITIASRAGTVLRAGGALADDVLLWAVPRSELARSRSLVDAGASERERPPTLTWTPLLVDPGEWERAATQHSAAYAVLNSRTETRRRWGLDERGERELRHAVVAGEPLDGLVPDAALQDVLVALEDPDDAADLAQSIRADGIAVPAASADQIALRVPWAARVLGASVTV